MTQSRVLLRWSLWLFLLLAIFFDSVRSFSKGAGSCDSGVAVRGYHLDSNNGRSVQTGTLKQAGIQVTVDSAQLLPDNHLTLQTGIEHNLQLYMAVAVFRGILIRVSSPDGEDLTGIMTTADPLLKTAGVCPIGVVGITHRSGVDKDMVYAVLRFDTPVSNVLLEITVVGMNNKKGSLYAYSAYNNIQFQTETESAVAVIPSFLVSTVNQSAVPARPPAPDIAELQAAYQFNTSSVATVSAPVSTKQVSNETPSPVSSAVAQTAANARGDIDERLSSIGQDSSASSAQLSLVTTTLLLLASTLI
jgi:hypothetical protein